MVDLSGIPDVEREDEVVLWGEQRGAAIELNEVAEWARTIPYDLLCNMGKRVVRVFMSGGEPTKVLTLIGERQETETVEGGGSSGAPRRRRRSVRYRNARSGS